MDLLQSSKLAWGIIPRDVMRIFRDVHATIRAIDPWTLRLAWIGAIITGLAGLGGFLLLGGAANYALEHWKQFTDHGMPWTLIVLASITVTLFQFGRNAVESIVRWRRDEFGARLEYALERQNVALLMSLDPGRLMDPEFVKLRTAATRWKGSRAVHDLFDHEFRMISGAVGVIAAISAIIVLEPWFLLFMIPAIVLEGSKSLLFDKRARLLWDENMLIERRKDAYVHELERSGPLIQAKMFRAADHWHARFSALLGDLQNAMSAFRIWECKWEIVVGLASSAMGLAVIGYLAHRIYIGTIGIAEVLIFWGAAQTLQHSLSSLTHTFANIRNCCIDYGYREQFLDAKPLIEEVGTEKFVFASTPRIELKNVTFRYPRTGTKILEDCSLVIEPGEKVAIVGENGAGKTTLLSLISKIYLPENGEVLIGDIPTQRIEQRSWYEQMLYSTQSHSIPQFTVDEIIGSGPPESVDEGRLRKAIDFSRSNTFLETKPDGYRTQIGTDWPGGWQPSSGQAQRILISAAAYRMLEPQVRIVLFDEPMSNCDIETREFFYHNVTAPSDKTVITVAHDPLYLNFFSRVIVIEDGKVAADMRAEGEIESYRQNAVARFRGLRVVSKA